VVDTTEEVSRNSEPVPDSSSSMVTANYLISIPSADENEDECDGAESSETISSNLTPIPSQPRPPPPRSMRMVSVQLERISMEWSIEDMKYCPASIEINDYRR
jgi:hypothetical protein